MPSSSDGHARRRQCERAGRNIRTYQQRQSSLRDRVAELRDLDYRARLEVSELRQRIDQISAEQEALRAVAGRGGIAGTIAGEVGAKIIALARQKDSLERRLEQLEAKLSRIAPLLRQSEARLKETDLLLSQSHDAFDRLGCTLSDLPF